MLTFPINWTTGTDDQVTEVHIHSSIWKIIILSVERAVEFRRNVTFDEVLISGALTLINLKGLSGTFGSSYQNEQVFSKFMKVGSSVEKIKFDDLPPIYSRLKYKLYGTVIIFNITQHCSAACKSLVELSNELEGMLDPLTCCFSDVNLKCGSESMPAHKSLLSARSSVFAAMFKNSMKESHDNEVDINDMDVPVLRSMLTYIYTGRVPDLTVSSAGGLLFAADKYQLLDLKRVCCDFLKDNFSLENVLGILVLGDIHSENELKYNALKYICSTCKKFSVLEETEEWKRIVKERTNLAMEILTTVLKSRDE